MALSFDQIRNKIQANLDKREVYSWVRDIFSTYFIFTEGISESKLYKVPFKVSGNDIDINWDKQSEVQVQYRTVKEAISLLESEFVKEERIVKDAILIRAGESKNRNFYDWDVLKRDAVTVFENAASHAGHEHINNELMRSDPRNLVGYLKNVRLSESDQTIRGDFHYFPDFDQQIEKVQEAHSSGLTDLFGLSITSGATARIGRRNGRPVRIIESLFKDSKTAVDFVVGPSAGGRLLESIIEEGNEIMELEKLTLDELKTARPDIIETLRAELKGVETTLTVESLKTDHKDLYDSILAESEKIPTPSPDITEVVERQVKEQIRLVECKLELTTSLSNANLPQEYTDKVRSQFDGRIFESEDLKKEIDFWKGIAARISESHRPMNNDRIDVGLEPSDKMQIAMDMLWGVELSAEEKQGVKPFKGLREAYTRYTGDIDVTGHVRVSEAFTSASLPNALANSMTKRLIQDYRQANVGWRKICSVSSVPDFKTQERIRVGYFGDIPIVDPEAADYVEQAPYSDEKATGAVSQRGSIVTVTRKHIINDDMNTISKMVGRLGRSAARTLDKFIFVDMLEANPAYTIDGLVMFADGPGTHDNLTAGLALTDTNIQTLLDDIMAKTEPGSGEKIGWTFEQGGAILIVPTGQIWNAIKVNQWNPQEAAGMINTMYHYFGANNENILVSPWLTDVNDYYVMLAPSIYDGLEVMFLQGKEEPEFFLADNPVVGDMFVADKLKYKVRHEYGAIWLDYRGAAKATHA